MRIHILKTSIFLKCYITSLFLISLPPFFVHSEFLNTHIAAKILIAMGFLYSIKRVIRNKTYKRMIINSYGKIGILALIYLLFQSIPIITAVDVVSYIQKYEDLVFGFLVLFNTIIFLTTFNKPHYIVQVLLSSAIINIGLQLYLFASLMGGFNPIIDTLIHPKYSQLIMMNLSRDRVFIENYDEALIPLFLYQLTYSDIQNKSIFKVLFFLILLCSIISGSRTKLIMFLFASVSYILINLRRKILQTSIIAFVLLIIVLTMSASLLLPKSNSANRIISSDNLDTNTIITRLERWNKGILIASFSPYIGVGLGNYYDYLSFDQKKGVSLFTIDNEKFELAAYYPHNILIETLTESGIAGLLSFIALIGYITFILIRHGMHPHKINIYYALSLAVLFIYAFFNPANTIKYQSLFWLLIALVFYTNNHEDFARP